MRSKRPFHDPFFRVGPELEAEVQSANDDKLSDEDVQALLCAYRAGSDEAKQSLTKCHRWLVYDVSHIDETYRHDWWSDLYQSLSIAIDRLRKNKITDIEGFVRLELQRGIQTYYRSISRHLPTMKKKKWPLKRAWPEWNEKQRAFVDPIDDLEELAAQGHVADYEDFAIVDLRDVIKSLGPTAVEVIAALEGGHKERDIARTLGIKRYQVRKVKDQLAEALAP
jgi:hypothetical protein